MLYVGILQEAFSADSYLVLPIDSLGTSYYAMVAGPSNKPNMLAVAATEDMTTVTITLPPEAADGKSLIIHISHIYCACHHDIIFNNLILFGALLTLTDIGLHNARFQESSIN